MTWIYTGACPFKQCECWGGVMQLQFTFLVNCNDIQLISLSWVYFELQCFTERASLETAVAKYPVTQVARPILASQFLKTNALNVQWGV